MRETEELRRKYSKQKIQPILHTAWCTNMNDTKMRSDPSSYDVFCLHHVNIYGRIVFKIILLSSKIYLKIKTYQGKNKFRCDIWQR